MSLTVVGWTDSGNGLQRAEQAAGADPGFWAAAERLRQSELRRPPEGVRDTRGTPLWSLLRVRHSGRLPHWCLAVQYRAPGHAAGTLQVAFSQNDVSAGDVWVAAASLIDGDGLLPWRPEPVGLTSAWKAFDRLAGGSRGQRAELAGRIEHTLIRLLVEQSRIRVEGGPSEAQMVLGRVLALVPDEVIGDYLWTTCLLHLPESAKNRVVSGGWPESLARGEPETAQRIAGVLADRGDPPPALVRRYQPLIARLAERAAKGHYQVGPEQRNAQDVRDLLELQEDEDPEPAPAPPIEGQSRPTESLRPASEQHGEKMEFLPAQWRRSPDRHGSVEPHGAGSARGSATVQNSADVQEPPTASSGVSRPPTRERLRSQRRAVTVEEVKEWVGDDAGEAAKWLFADTVSERANRGDTLEKEVIRSLVRLADAASTFAGLLPVPDGAGQVNEPSAARLASLLEVHCRRPELEALFTGVSRRYYRGDRTGDRDLFLNHLRISADRDAIDDDPTVGEIADAARREASRKTSSRRALADVVDVSRIAPITAFVRAAGRRAGGDHVPPTVAALLLELLGSSFRRDAPHLFPTGALTDAQCDCVRVWIRQARRPGDGWLVRVMQVLREHDRGSVDLAAVLGAGLREVSLDTEDMPIEIRELRQLVHRHPSAEASEAMAEIEYRIGSSGAAPPPVDGGPARHPTLAEPSGGGTSRFPTALRNSAALRNAVGRPQDHPVMAVLVLVTLMVIGLAAGLFYVSVRDAAEFDGGTTPTASADRTGTEPGQQETGQQEAGQLNTVGSITSDIRIDGSYPGVIAVTGTAYDGNDLGTAVQYRVSARQRYQFDAKDLWHGEYVAGFNRPAAGAVGGRHGVAAGLRVPGGGQFTVEVTVLGAGGTWHSMATSDVNVKPAGKLNFPEAADLRVDSAGGGAYTLRGFARGTLGENPPGVVVVLGTPATTSVQHASARGAFRAATAAQPPFVVSLSRDLPRGRFLAWLYLAGENDTWYFWAVTPVELN